MHEKILQQLKKKKRMTLYSPRKGDVQMAHEPGDGWLPESFTFHYYDGHAETFVQTYARNREEFLELARHFFPEKS